MNEYNVSIVVHAVVTEGRTSGRARPKVHFAQKLTGATHPIDQVFKVAIRTYVPTKSDLDLNGKMVGSSLRP